MANPVADEFEEIAKRLKELLKQKEDELAKPSLEEVPPDKQAPIYFMGMHIASKEELDVVKAWWESISKPVTW
jgi:hypothetical protein